jgi:TRAP-type C4-dicarboxylate transport system permease small subunit
VKEIQHAPGEGESPGVLVKIAFFIGSLALMLAMSTDAIAVLGRHLGWPLLGSIEIVQACIVLAAAAAMVMATLHDAHARVHVLTERLPASWQRRLWLLGELWRGHEETELLHIPVRWLRLFWLCAALLIAGLFVVRAVRRSSRS